MASSSFVAENQSYSEANSSWASLIIDQVQNSMDEDCNTILDFASETGRRSASVDTHGRSKQSVDMKTFEQILKVMVQQGAALDNLRTELDQLRQERRQELGYRDARLRLAEKELRSLRAYKESSNAELEALLEELAAYKASEEESASSDLLTAEEHNRIVSRIKDDARGQTENVEAEKSHLTLQLSRLQIQIAQLRNQVDDRSYPEEVLEELTSSLRRTIIETCQTGDDEAQTVKQALAAAEERLSTLERQLESATSSRSDAEDRCAHIEQQYEGLHAEYETVQERLAILESTQGQPDETALKEAQEQTEELKAQLADVGKGRDVALSDCEQLRVLLNEAEEKRTALTADVKVVSDALMQTEDRLSGIQKERDGALSEIETLRSNMDGSQEKATAMATAAEKLKRDLKIVEEQRERVERVSKEAENELQTAKEKNYELSKALEQEQENSKTVAHLQSELEEELKSLKTSHAQEIAIKDGIMDAAAHKAEELQVKFNEEKQKASTLGVELAEMSKHSTEREQSLTSELEKLRAVFQDAVVVRDQAEAGLRGVFDNLQTADKDRSELEARLKMMQAELESTNKRQSEVESELRHTIQSKETELSQTKRKLELEVDRLQKCKTVAEENLLNERSLRRDVVEALETEKRELCKEICWLKTELSTAKAQVTNSQAPTDRDQVQQRRIGQLEESIKKARKAHSETLRENERFRLLYAEAEAGRAAAEMDNERHRQLKEEAKVQLAEVQKSMNATKDQHAKYMSEVNQCRTEIAELRVENEQLVAARRQMAAIYGLPSESLHSPRRTPTRIAPGTPVPRSSLSLSPSTSSAAPQFTDFPALPAGPPTKRRKVSKLSVAGSSPTSVIFLDDTDDHFVATPLTPTSREQNDTNEEIPKYIVRIYETFSKLASWSDYKNRPICGFCALHNHYHDKDRRAPLNFDPSVYPITFWNHCLMRHRNAMRPEIDAWLKAEGLKLTHSETFIFDDSPAILAKFVSWRTSETMFVCGLCQLENGRGDCEQLGFDPSDKTTKFWTHCHEKHVQFWRSVS